MIPWSSCLACISSSFIEFSFIFLASSGPIQHSDPYVITDLTTIIEILDFSIIETLLLTPFLLLNPIPLYPASTRTCFDLQIHLSTTSDPMQVHETIYLLQLLSMSICDCHMLSPVLLPSYYAPASPSFWSCHITSLFWSCFALSAA